MVEAIPSAMLPAILCWTIPIAGAFATLGLSKAGARARDYGAVLASVLTALSAVSLLPLLFGEGLPIDLRFDWVSLPFSEAPLSLGAGFLIDPLSIILCNVVAIISCLIMVYSLKYMEGDPSLTRYWFFMNLFIGNMLLLVLSDNFVQMLFGWEGVGLCSYALIGFWYRDSKEDWLKCWVGEGKESYPPSHSGMKAFMMTRFGDVLMLVGVFLLIVALGTANFLELQQGASSIAEPYKFLLLPAALLIFGGAVGKSAQLPLMEWLPDAMAGPTTVSALIHAATMVKAGVYLVARVFPIFYIALAADPGLIAFFQVVAWVGALTAFVAATQAMVSTELKKVLAYSTVSQIGYMMLGIGVAGTVAEFYLGYAGGVMHLMSHAVFKAALFLTAGAVIQAVGSRFMYHMGGLRKKMPLTYAAMLIASLSLMGMPVFFSGFWSKDMILESALLSGQYPLLILGLVTVSMTCFYTVRMLGLVFHGKPSERQSLEAAGGHLHPVDPSPKMTLPYLLLAAATVALGLAGYFQKEWLAELFAEYYAGVFGLGHIAISEELMPQLVTAALSTLFLLAGAVPAYLIYVRGRTPAPSGPLSAIRGLLFRRYYINALYYSLFVRPTMWLSGHLYSAVEVGFFDRLNAGIAAAALSASSKLRKSHSGDLNYNVLAFAVGLAMLMVIILVAVIW